MRRSTRPLLLLIATPLLALGCGGDDDDSPWCYSADESGAVRDSVRPDPGFVCVASARVAPALADSVRPDPGINLRAMRRNDLR